MKFVCLRDYRNGTVSYRKGEVYEIEPSMVAPLLRDGPGVFEFSRPATAADLQAIAARKEAERQAEENARRMEAEGREAVREWISRHGPWCPGRHGQGHMAWRTRGVDGPTGLECRRVDAGWWAIACHNHIDHIASLPEPPATPPGINRTVRRYRATTQYRAHYADVAWDPEGHMVPDHQRRRRLNFAEGDEIKLPVYIAQWIERDSPGALAPVDPHEGEG